MNIEAKRVCMHAKHACTKSNKINQYGINPRYGK